MSTRIHIVVDEAEKERFRARAGREGKTLSEWLRDVAREAVRRGEAEPGLRSAEELREFFRRCDEREQGVEPEWEAHRREIDESMGSGAAEP